MPHNATESQRELMRRLYRLHGGDEKAVCADYARAEVGGLIFRKAHDYRLTADQYAKALWDIGMTQGWLTEDFEPSVGLST